MSDFDTPHVTTDAPSRDLFDATLSAHDTLNAILREANKAALFAALAVAGISQVVVMFDGCGDSGQIESVEAKAGDDAVELPDAMVPVRMAEWGNPEPAPSHLPLAELIERLAYDYLGFTHAGWENNDGAFGEFVFDVAAGTITLDHNDRYTAIETCNHSF